MSALILMKQHPIVLTEAEKAAARRVLFGIIDGLSAEHKRRWRRMWQWFMDANAGEILEIYTKRARSPEFHRLQMLIETTVFESQDRFRKLDHFRDWLKVGAGHVEWIWVDGVLKCEPMSCSYDALEQDSFEEFHLNAIAFLRSPDGHRFLWPHLSERMSVEMINTLLQEFERER